MKTTEKINYIKNQLYSEQIIFQSAVVTAKRQITLHLPSQHHLGILQGLIIQQPVQFCPLCRGVAVLILDGDAVDGKGGV